MPSEPSPRLEAEQGRARWSTADVLSAVRIPLAIAFPFASNDVRLALLAAAAASDLLDGQLARRFGSSSLGAVIDPVADKLFMASAFGVVAFSGRLEWYEILGVLLRDIVATVAFVATYRVPPAACDPRPGRRQGRDRGAGAHPDRLPGRLTLPAPARLGHDRGGAVRDLGLLPGGAHAPSAGWVEGDGVMTIETKRVSLAWQERLVFRGGEPGGPETTIDGDNAAGPGPMLTLLLAAAACTGADVVAILEKMRVDPARAPHRGER